MITDKQVFDRQTGYKREQQESFAYCHALKNGRIAAIQEQTRIRVEQERQRRQERLQVEKAQQQYQVTEREQQRRSRCIGR